MRRMAPGRLKLVILSDLHILPEGVLSLGLDTTARLRSGVAAINARHADADLVVIAGDLADLGEAEAYARLREALADLTVPVAITIGNHDDRAVFLEVFGADSAAPTGYVDQAIDLKEHRILLLDSAIAPGTHSGELASQQLDWLADRLAEADGRPVIVVLHHHANPLLTAVDRIPLTNPDAFVAVLKSHADIRQVIAGHVHFTSTAVWHGLPFTTLAGSTYSVTVPTEDANAPIDRLTGPGQMAVVFSDAEGTLVHFDNYVDDHRVIAPE